MQCQSSSKQTGQQCKGRAITGASYCRMHGGKQQGKSNLATLKHGAYSYIIPEQLRVGYETFLSDTQLLNLDPDVALLRTLLNKHLEVLKDKEVVSSDHLLSLSHVIDRLGKLVERREKVHHLQHNVVTHDKLVTWITQLATGIQNGIEQHVSSEDERQQLVNHVRVLVAALGVPGG